MDLRVFRQASKARPDGCIIYKGEDARPYVDGNIMLVADGLGGAAAIRHQKFNQELFDAGKLFDILFEGVFDSLDDMDLREYVCKSFHEFFCIKDCYFDNVNNIKKSGYFASRIVSAIFIYLAKRFISTKPISDYCENVDQKQREDRLKETSQYFTENIGAMLKKVAENANLIYETSFSGLALLGTTLCATIFDEGTNFIDAIYFVSGDSRPYMWNENGLFQVSADQERADGGMTNYIKANGDFKVNCEYKRFQKPCILFNATDGIFDSARFKLSQMAFEKLLLQIVLQADTFEQIGEKLESIFAEYGTHDDSSTISLKTYGYNSFEELKCVARERLSYIKETYLKDFPELLEHDYQKDIDEIEYGKMTRRKALSRALWTNDKVVEYYCQSAKRQDDGKFTMQIEELNETYHKIYSMILKTIENNLFRKHNVIATAESESEMLANDLLAEKYDIEELCLSREDSEQLKGWLLTYANIGNQIMKAKKEQNESITTTANGLFNEQCEKGQDILIYLLEKRILAYDEYEQYLKQFPIIGDDVDDGIVEKANLQRELLAKYDKQYYSLIS